MTTTTNRCKRWLAIEHASLLPKFPLVEPGQRFERVTVLGWPFWGTTTRRYQAAVFKCECGKVCVLRVSQVISGRTSSCGCLRVRLLVDRFTKHGLRKHPLYQTWLGILKRCRNKKCDMYPHYGGRGILVCDEWACDFKAFHDWSLANGWSRELQIDRRNNDGHYTPDNCRWVTPKVNANNTSRNHRIEAFSETKTLAGWVDDARCSITYSTLITRLKRGWNVEEAITTPRIRRQKEAV